MTAVATPGSSDMSASLYEELRDRVLAGKALGDQVGLAHLLREGMAAWLARRASCVTASSRATQMQRAAATGSLCSDEHHASIVQVLASMALAGRTEMRV